MSLNYVWHISNCKNSYHHAQSHMTLCNPVDCDLSWSGLPFLPPGNLLDPGIKLVSPTSLALADGIHLPMQEMWVWSLGREAPLEKEMSTHSSILAWEIPWTEKPGKLQSLGSQRILIEDEIFELWTQSWTVPPTWSLSMLVILGLGLNLNQ